MRTLTEGLKSFGKLGSDISVINRLNENNNFATELQEHATLYFNSYGNKSTNKEFITIYLLKREY
mgnify:FL=1